MPRLTPVGQNWRDGHAGHAPEAAAAVAAERGWPVLRQL
jgi:hypothetical protein